MERRTNIQTAIHGKNHHRTAVAAKCMACRAVSSNDPNAAQYLDFACQVCSSLSDPGYRKSIKRDLEIIRFTHTHLDGLRPKEEAQKSLILSHIDKIFSMEPGIYEIRRVEKLFLTNLAAKLLNTTDLKRRTRDLALETQKKGKINHCLFDLKALLVELGISFKKGMP